MKEELSFEIVIASTEEQLRAACSVRVAAYDHHVPGFGQQMAAPDDLDRDPNTLVFLARDKRTSKVVGTARLSSNARRPLLIESSLSSIYELPGKRLAEVTRLAILPGDADPKLRWILVKAMWMAGIVMQIDRCLVGARNSALRRAYHSMGFENLTPPNEPVPLSYAGNIPHHVLVLDVLDAPMRWKDREHPLYSLGRIFHPDIQLKLHAPKESRVEALAA